MAPADLGTDSGNGAAVPALPMHTDPVSIAVRQCSRLQSDASATLPATCCLPQGSCVLFSCNARIHQTAKYQCPMCAVPGGGEADGAAEQGWRHGAHGGAGQHVAAGAHMPLPVVSTLSRRDWVQGACNAVTT